MLNMKDVARIKNCTLKGSFLFGVALFCLQPSWSYAEDVLESALVGAGSGDTAKLVQGDVINRAAEDTLAADLIEAGSLDIEPVDSQEIEAPDSGEPGVIEVSGEPVGGGEALDDTAAEHAEDSSVDEDALDVAEAEVRQALKVAKSGNAPKDLQLSLSTIILFALENNPDIGIAYARKMQAFHSIGEVQAKLYPQASLNASLSRDLNDPASGADVEAGQSRVTGTSSVNVSVTQLLFDGFSSIEVIKNREELERTADIQIDIAAQKVIRETIEAYLNVYRSQSVYLDRVRFLRRMREISDKIEVMAEAGAASQAKVGFAKARLAFARTEMQNIKAELNDAISSLEFLTGELPEFTAKRPEELDPSVLDIDFYLDMAVKQNKQMLLNDSNKKALEHQLNSEAGKELPSVSFDFNFNQRYNDGGEVGSERDIVSAITVSYDLFDGFKKKSVQKRVMSQIDEVDFKRNKVLKTLERDIKLSYNQIESIQQNLVVTEEEIAANIDVQRLNYENFELGNIDIIELIEGEERLNSSRSRRYSEITDLYVNSFELLKLVGALQKQSFCGSC